MAAAELSLSAVVQANGVARCSFGPDSRFQRWTMQQVSVEMSTAPVGATCSLRKGGVLVTPLIATGDAASGEPSIPLRPGEELTVEFKGCTPGDVGTIYALYDDGTDL